MRKTDPHQKCSSIKPEASGPRAEIAPPSADHSAIDRVRAGPDHKAVISASVAAVSLVGGWTWAAGLQTGFDSRAETISALAASATPHRWVMTSALVVTGLAHVVTAWALGDARRGGRLALAGAGVATLAVAALPLPSRAESATGHVVAASWLGKAKTLSQNVAIGALIFHFPTAGLPAHAIGMVCLGVATALTLWSGYLYFADYFGRRP